MSFLAPAYFVAALGLAAAVLAFHFIVTRQPPSGPLPTARFVPAARVEVTTLARRPEDLLLLLLRIALVLCVGAAFARPVVPPAHRPILRIVLADLSREVKSLAEVRDSVARIGPDRLFAFDSIVRRVEEAGAEWTASAGTDRPGHLSSALIAGLRAGAELRGSADSIELVLVSPLAADEWDAATPVIRKLWPGPIRLVRVHGSRDSLPVPHEVMVRADGDDPLAVALASAGFRQSDSVVRLVRGRSTDADSLWATAGGTLVRWPSDSAPPGWQALSRPDTAGAVYASGVVVIHPFERRWQPPVGSGRIIARWMDGTPAAVERKAGAGCIREIGIAVPSRGDLMLRSDFARLLDGLVAPCGAAPRQRIAAGLVAALAGTGPLASRATLTAPELRITPLVPWLLSAALLLALLELVVRRFSRRPGEIG